MGKRLFKKYSKFQDTNKIFFSMTRFSNIKLGVLRQYQSTKKKKLKKKNIEESHFKKPSKLQKFQ